MIRCRGGGLRHDSGGWWRFPRLENFLEGDK